eukprot:6208640-Pleurochrysis_carterae.AAC.5
MWGQVDYWTAAMSNDLIHYHILEIMTMVSEVVTNMYRYPCLRRLLSFRIPTISPDLDVRQNRRWQLQPRRTPWRQSSPQPVAQVTAAIAEPCSSRRAGRCGGAAMGCTKSRLSSNDPNYADSAPARAGNGDQENMPLTGSSRAYWQRTKVNASQLWTVHSTMTVAKNAQAQGMPEPPDSFFETQDRLVNFFYAHGKQRTFMPGEVIMEPDDELKVLYLVEEGSCAMQKDVKVMRRKPAPTKAISTNRPETAE